MKPQRIWPVRGSRGKYSRQFSLRVRPRMDFQNVPPSPVQPGHNEKFVSGGNSFETARREGIRFKPSVRRSFRTLLRRFFAILDRRSNDRDRTQLQACASHRRLLRSASSFAPACHAHFLQASAKRSLFSTASCAARAPALSVSATARALEPPPSLQLAQRRCPPATRHQDSALPTVRRSLRFAKPPGMPQRAASSHMTRRFSSMNQGIRTPIYPVKDAQRSSTFFRRLLGVDPCVAQPYCVAFRLGDQEIALRPNGRLSRLECNSTLCRSTSPLRLTIPPFTPKMKLSQLSRVASRKSL